MSERLYFGKIKEAIDPPNLIEVQLNSYVEFLQKDVHAQQAQGHGPAGGVPGSFPDQELRRESHARFRALRDRRAEAERRSKRMREGQTFSAPLHVTFQLKEEKGTKEEKVYMGEIPLMTPQGTFVINGAERVVVSQLHRSPGICFESSHASERQGALLASASSLTAAPGWKCSSTRTTCFTSTSTAASAAGSSSRPRSSASLGYGSDEDDRQALLHDRGPQAQREPRGRRDRDQGAHRRRARRRDHAWRAPSSR